MNDERSKIVVTGRVSNPVLISGRNPEWQALADSIADLKDRLIRIETRIVLFETSTIPGPFLAGLLSAMEESDHELVQKRLETYWQYVEDVKTKMEAWLAENGEAQP